MTHLDLELSAYLDGELAAADVARVEAHLAECGECRATLESLQQLVRRAAALDDRAPERDLWPGIADRIASSPTADVLPFERRRRFAFTVPQLAAAAVAMIVLSAAVTTLALRAPLGAAALGTGPADTAQAGAILVSSPAIPGQPGVDSYEAAIRDLQATLQQRRGELDTATVRVLEQSLRLIDIAIAQARAALAHDPNDPYLNGHLQRALDRKLDLLRQVATLPVVS